MLDLTFDDGPSEWTPAICDVLAEYERKATFFVIGSNITGQGKVLERIVREGHTIGNHTFSHRRLTEIPFKEVSLQMRACNDVVELACGVKPHVWRAPYLSSSELIDQLAAFLGMKHRGGGIDPLDWKHTDPEMIANNVLGKATKGATVSLHDGIPPDGGNGTDSRQPTADALRLILEAGW